MRTWAPLWSMVVDSSLWSEPDYVVKIFLTMMALKDSDHVYRGSAFSLAQRAHKTEAEVLDALKILASPDARRIETQEYDGRRIQAVEDGWLILNGEKYRKLMSDEMRRARNREAQRRFRLKNKGRPIAGEVLAIRGVENGTVCSRCFESAHEGECGAK